MNRPIALVSLASLAVAFVAVGCHAVDLGGDGGGGGDSRATGGGDVGPGSGGAEQSVGGGQGVGGDRATGSGGEASSSSDGGSQSSGTGGAPAAVCPTMVQGALTQYAHAPYGPQGIAIDAGAIYWTGFAQSTGAGAVLRTDLASGVTTEIANAALDPALPSDAFEYPGGIARSQGDVIWTAGSGAEVVKVPATGGAATLLFHDASNNHVPGTGVSPHTFMVDATNVYWNDVVRNGNPLTNFLYAMPLGGGAVTTMASNTVDPTDPNAPPFEPLSLRVDGANAFYTLWAGGTSMAVTRRVGIDGQNSVDLMQAGFLLAPDGTTLYHAFESIVVSQPEAGGGETLVLGPAGGDIFETYQSIVEHGSDLYLTSFGSWFDGQSWTVEDCGWVKKVPKSGGNATILWAGAGRPYDLAVDDTSVTWSDLDNQNILRLAP